MRTECVCFIFLFVTFIKGDVKSNITLSEGGPINVNTVEGNLSNLNRIDSVKNFNTTTSSSGIRKSSVVKKVLPPINPNISNTAINKSEYNLLNSTNFSVSTNNEGKTVGKKGVGLFKPKPSFTMVKDDNNVKSSFIQSSTTGRDYVVPIVFGTLLLPIVFLVCKLIYQRGSAYTERRYYDRMYLIDGMYNTK